MLSTTPPCGYYVQLQHPQALEITAALVVDSCNCSEVPLKPTERCASSWPTAATAAPILSATPPSGYHPQLQHPNPPKAYRAQRLLVANSHKCSLYVEHNTPLWLLCAITTITQT